MEVEVGAEAVEVGRWLKNGASNGDLKATPPRAGAIGQAMCKHDRTLAGASYDAHAEKLHKRGG